jgi:alkaline phosphatase D
MLRGIGSLLKAQMVWTHGEFADAACIYLWIALEAAHSLTLRKVWESNGEHFFEGIVRRDPVDKPKIVVASLSCLNDFGFPHSDLLSSVQHFKPDFAAFQGDQIYERCAGYGMQRFPLETATLDYLRKWWLFGWPFRDIMRDMPTICMTDDHDVYQGNLWGAGGRHAEGLGQDGQDSGGYIEPAAWVNMMQRTQTSHLPDPYDPTPVEQNIAISYTELRWGGISFAILEDRKGKSVPKIKIPFARIKNGWAQNPDYNAVRNGDVAGAELLGPRQLSFLDHWAQDWSRGTWLKVALSQTLLANIATLPPPADTDAVVPHLPILKVGGYAEDDMLVADHMLWLTTIRTDGRKVDNERLRLPPRPKGWGGESPGSRPQPQPFIPRPSLRTRTRETF